MENFHRIGHSSAKTLSRLRGKERALSREAGGELRLVEIRQPADWQPYERAIEDLMKAAWQARHLGHGLRLAEQIKLAERGWLRAFLLLAGERAAAFVLCYQGLGTLFYEQLGYDQRLARHSPGMILLYRVLEHVRQHDPPAFIDFGEGAAEYKQALANDTIQAHGLLLVRRVAGLPRAFRLARMGRGVDGLLRRLLAGVGLKRWLWQRAKRGAA